MESQLGSRPPGPGSRARACSRRRGPLRTGVWASGCWAVAGDRSARRRGPAVCAAGRTGRRAGGRRYTRSCQGRQWPSCSLDVLLRISAVLTWQLRRARRRSEGMCTAGPARRTSPRPTTRSGWCYSRLLAGARGRYRRLRDHLVSAVCMHLAPAPAPHARTVCVVERRLGTMQQGRGMVRSDAAQKMETSG